MNLKLNKSSWTPSFIGDVADEIKDKLQSLDGLEKAKFIRPEDLLIGDLFVNNYRSTEGVKSGKKCQKGDILFARRSVSISQFKKRSCITDYDAICSDELTVIREYDDQIEKGFLNLILNTNKLWDFGISHSGGSVSKRIKWQDLKNFNFYLPSIEDQKKLLSLFLNIENQIEQTEEQEKNLISLRTKMATELVCEDAQLGTLLNEKNCKPSTLGAIAKETRESTKTPLDEGIERFVGLEHIEPGNLKIQGWGNVEDGTTFTKIFKIGDVLFGRRRAYLKKAAHADFTGLCSGDITVLRADTKLILADLLPYYLSADPVFKYAVSNSAGSLSPRAKWRDLSKYEISLPDLKMQEKILETFQLLDANIIGNNEQRSTLKKLKHQLLDEILG